MATLKDLSKRTGVSVTTISRVLNQDETMLVSRETKRAIFDAAFQLGYVPPRRRKRQPQQHTLIGVADWRILVSGAPNITLPAMRYFAQVEYPAKSVEFIQIGRDLSTPADGIIAVGDFSPGEVQGLRRASPYLVLVNSSQKDLSCDQVQVDLDSALEQALDYLAGQKGYRTIGYIGGIHEEDGYTIGSRRMKRMVSLLLDQGLYDPALVQTGDFSPEAGYAMARGLLEGSPLPQALVIGSDMLAVGVLRALEEQKIAIPRDMELVVYRDIQTTQLPKGGYAVIQAYPDLLWQKAVQMLMEQMGGRSEAVRTIISPRLLLDGERE